MTANRSVKVILDTNVWISFLIGKKLLFLKELIVNEQIKIVLCPELIEEIESVANRPHLKRYNTDKLVEELKILLDIVAEAFQITPKHDACRDPKDNFLLDLMDVSQADYLITGDKDLLILDPFLQTRIITVTEFQQLMALA